MFNVSFTQKLLEQRVERALVCPGVQRSRTSPSPAVSFQKQLIFFSKPQLIQQQHAANASPVLSTESNQGGDDGSPLRTRECDTSGRDVCWKHFRCTSSHPRVGPSGKQQCPPVWSPSHADRSGVGLILSLLFHVLTAGKELFGLDTLQKSLWIQLLEEMFLGMPSEFPWGDEIMLFLNVFNGALILHPEDSALLRQYAATVINSAVHFNHLFSLSGYQWILPTMLQVLWLCPPHQKINGLYGRSTRPVLKLKDGIIICFFLAAEGTK